MTDISARNCIMRGGKAAAALAVWPENDSETSLGGGTERAVKQEGGRGAAVEQGDGGAGWRLGAGAAGSRSLRKT